MDFLNLKPVAFALDLSDYSAKFLFLEKKGEKFKVKAFGEQKIKEGLIREGEIVNEEKVAEILKEGKKKTKGKISTKYCFATLPEEKAFFFFLEFPRMREEDLKSAILFQLEDLLPLPLHKIYFDYEIVKEKDRSFKVLVVAIEKEIVDSYLRVLEKAGFFPLALEVECQSIQRALLQKDLILEPLLILDFGESKTTIILVFEGSILLTKSIPIGGKVFDEQIAKNLKIKKERAEKLKIKYGLGEELILKFSEKEKPEKIFVKNKIFEALIPSLTSLVEEIKKVIDFSQTHFKQEFQNQKISKILISGGQAQMLGLKEFLETDLQIRVEVGKPGKEKVIFPQDPSFKELSFCTAVGLALRNFYD